MFLKFCFKEQPQIKKLVLQRMRYEVTEYNNKVQAELVPPTFRIHRDTNLTAPCSHFKQTNKQINKQTNK
jgi:hypothetical protein